MNHGKCENQKVEVESMKKNHLRCNPYKVIPGSRIRNLHNFFLFDFVTSAYSVVEKSFQFLLQNISNKLKTIISFVFSN